jgi:hypothetical protein
MGEVVAGEDDAGDGVSEKVRNWVSEESKMMISLMWFFMLRYQ